MADKAEKKSSADKGETKSVASKFKGYVARPEVKELYATLKVSAKVIDGVSKTMEILSKPWVKKRLPSIAAKVAKLTNFSKLLGPAGVAVGVGVDLLSAIGLVEDAVMDKLNQISRQIEELRDDVNKGFEEIKIILDRNLALMPFLTIYNKLQAQVDVYEQNVVSAQIDPTIFLKRLADMIHEGTIDGIISDLKQIHNMISGNTFGSKPLFEELARGVQGKEGTEFDQFMANLLCQFQAVLALEIRAVRMLRSFLAFSEKDITYGQDIKHILNNLGTQRHLYDPVQLFQWYLDFMSKGGKFNIRVLKPDNRYLYVEYGNHRVSGWKSYPGPKGEFTIEPCYDKTHRTSLSSSVGENSFHVWCKNYPGEFMDLRDNKKGADVKTRKNKADLEAHWYFHIVDMDAKVFKLSTVKWPDRFVYMEDGMFTEVRGCDDDHKSSDQAKFQLHPI